MYIRLDELTPLYQKFLRANFTTGEYEIGKIADDEQAEIEKSLPETIQDYFEWFANSSFIHNDDRKRFLEATEYIDAGDCVLYQRKLFGCWRRVLMQVVASQNYTDDNRDCIIYVRDVEDIYQQEYQRVVDSIGTTDQMTGLLNRVAFERDMENYKKDFIGIAFIDLNGLKYTNDNFGHSAGDELIIKLANLLLLQFPDCRCYHISGDEFVVISWDCSIRKFLWDAIAMHKGLWNTQDYPMASIGYSVGERKEIGYVYRDAERAMQDDKRMFYTKYPKYIRK